MTNLKLISVSKPNQGFVYKQEFEFEGTVTKTNGLEIKYFDKTIKSDTHVKLDKRFGFIKNKSLTINLSKQGSVSLVHTKHGKIELKFVHKYHKVFQNSAIIAYSIHDNKTNVKLSDNLIKYKWSI